MGERIGLEKVRSKVDPSQIAEVSVQRWTYSMANARGFAELLPPVRGQHGVAVSWVDAEDGGRYINDAKVFPCRIDCDMHEDDEGYRKTVQIDANELFGLPQDFESSPLT